MQTVIVEIPVAAERLDEIVAAAQTAEASWMTPPACTGVRILASADRDLVTIVQDWESQEAHDRAEAQPHVQQALAAIGGMAAGPARAVWYRDA